MTPWISSAAEPASGDKVMDQIEHLLSKGNIEVGDRVRNARALLSTVPGGAMAVLERQIADYDFEAALNTLRQVRQARPNRDDESASDEPA